MTSASVDPEEVGRFGRAAAHWWDPKGPLAPLHAMQPVRLDYLRAQITGGLGLDAGGRRPLTGLRLVDIGCGGGLASEPMARLGASVTGLDPSGDAIAAARAHADEQGLEIDYRVSAAEEFAAAVAAGREAPVDVALALEVIEHTADRASLLQAMAGMLKPGGLAALTTVNRTAKSFLGAIIVAEYALRWLEPGTHDWRKFPTPDELEADLEAAGLRVVDRTGFVYAPVSRRWRQDAGDLSMNYALIAEKPYEA